MLLTTAEGRAARLGHALTLRVLEWSATVTFEDDQPSEVTVTMDLGRLEVVKGEGGLKPLSERDKRSVLDGARSTIGPAGVATFTSESIRDSWTVLGVLDFHGTRRQQRVEVRLDGDRLQAQTVVRQSDHGITPFSQMRGTLAVGDAVRVQLDCRA